jgi:hypothetical protein
LRGYRRGFDDEVERLITVNGDDNRQNFARLILGPCIKLLAELHDVDTF